MDICRPRSGGVNFFAYNGNKAVLHVNFKGKEDTVYLYEDVDSSEFGEIYERHQQTLADPNVKFFELIKKLIIDNPENHPFSTLTTDEFFNIIGKDPAPIPSFIPCDGFSAVNSRW